MSAAQVQDLYLQSTVPVITLPGTDPVPADEQVWTILDASATVADPDSANFDTGALTVRVTNPFVGDRLAFNHEGSGPGQIGRVSTPSGPFAASGSVTYGGTTIATFNWTAGTSTLSFTFNANATPTAVQALVRTIIYIANVDNPNTTQRLIDFALTDGDGGSSATLTKHVNINPLNDAPVISNFSPDITYLENGLPVQIDADVSITDPDYLNYDGGTLTIDFSAGGTTTDQLAIGNIGTVTTIGSNVLVNGTSIGSFSGGANGAALVVNFNTAAINARVTPLLQALTYASTSENPATTRTVRVVVTDGDGGTSAPVTKVITVTPINDTPTTTGIANITVNEDAADTTVDLWPSFADAEDTDGQLTYTVTNDTNAALFTSVTVTGAPSQYLVLNYAPDANGTADITVRATDTGGLWVETTFTVTVNAINDTPTVADPIANVTVNEDAADTLLDLSTVFADVDIATNGDSLTLTVAGNTNATLVTTNILGTTLTLDFQPGQNGAATITVRATDSAGAYVEDSFLVTVNPVNDTPTTSGISNVTVNEDALDTTIDLWPSFADVEDTDGQLTYTVTNNTNAALFTSVTVTGTPNQYLVLDYAPNANGTADITVRATDTGGLWVETTFTVTVNPVNDTPTGLVLSNTNIQENQSTGTLVGTLSTADPDTGDTFTYSLQTGIPGCDGSGNTSFQIPAGTNRLENAVSFDYETPPTTFAVCIRTTDSGGLTYDRAFTVTVTDVDDIAPAVTSILRQTPLTSPTNAVSVIFRVTFGEDVQNVTPTDFGLALTGTATGTINAVIVQSASVYDVVVTGVGGTGTLGLGFSVTNDIQDLIGNALGTTPSIGTQENYDIDNTAITVIGGGVVGNPGSLGILNAGAYTVHFSSIEVTFDADAADPAGNTGTDDVTNPANYLLLQSGPNGTYNTASCAAFAANSNLPLVDDIQVPTGPVTYDNHGGVGPFTATVTVNNGTSLPSGEYRLLVCGTTSITDLTGNPLGGGVDTVLTFRIFDPADLPATGFAPGRITRLPDRMKSQTYAALGDLWLEIPRLGVQMPIVGVPLANGTWDVSWLGKNAGWLESSAYPTWKGNSVLTGHVYDASGNPGPFARLNQLWWGDRVIVHINGQQYVYEVREVTQVGPNDAGTMLQHKDQPWLTLVTCRGYDEASNSYKYRVLIRAVLLEVK